MNLNFMKLREQMENQKVSYYLVPSEDPTSIRIRR